MNYRYRNELLSKYYDFEEIDTERTEEGISLCHSDYVEGIPTMYGTTKYVYVDSSDKPSDPDGPGGWIFLLVCSIAGCICCYNADTICPAIVDFACDICC